MKPEISRVKQALSATEFFHVIRGWNYSVPDNNKNDKFMI